MQTSEVVERGVLARERIAAQIPDRDHQIVEEAALPARNRALMTLERDLVLILASDLPLLRGDLGVLAHAQAGGAVRHRWDVQMNVSDPELCDVRRLVRERARLLKPRARLLQPRFGITAPHTANSGLAVPIMCWTTGTESAIASNEPSGPSTLANGV